MCKNKIFLTEFVDLINLLLFYPNNLQEIKIMYRFNAIFIDKPDGGKRPLCLSEIPVIVFHKILK
jgi:hypothetical protein